MKFFYPLKFLYDGRVYFVLAALAYFLSKIFPTTPTLIASIPFAGPVAAEVIAWLPTLGTILLVAGFVAAVLREIADSVWNTHLGTAVDAGFRKVAESIALGISNIDADIVIAWLARPQTQDNDFRRVAIAALAAHYGREQSDEEQSYLNFIINNFLDKSAVRSGVTRENYSSHIVLEKTKIESEDMIQWAENRSYDLICPSANNEIQPTFLTSSLAPPSVVNKLAQRMVMSISLGGEKHFELKDWLKPFTDLDFNKTPELSTDEAVMTYDGTWLALRLKKPLKLSKHKQTVSIRENSFLPVDERFYYSIMEQPTRAVRVNMRLGTGLENWIVKDPILSSQRYHRQASDLATISRQGDRECSAVVEKWVLPGIAFVIEWHPKYE